MKWMECMSSRSVEGCWKMIQSVWYLNTEHNIMLELRNLVRINVIPIRYDMFCFSTITLLLWFSLQFAVGNFVNNFCCIKSGHRFEFECCVFVCVDVWEILCSPLQCLSTIIHLLAIRHSKWIFCKLGNVHLEGFELEAGVCNGGVCSWIDCIYSVYVSNVSNGFLCSMCHFVPLIKLFHLFDHEVENCITLTIAILYFVLQIVCVERSTKRRYSDICLLFCRFFG